MKNKLLIVLFFLMGACIVFGGCGGGGGGGNNNENPATIQVSGVVATGAPLNPAVVTAVNIHGEAAGPVNVNADGTYTLSIVEGAPYVLKAYCQSRDITLFSYASGEGTTNITPLTNLALFVAAGLDKDLAALYNTWATASISESDVMTAARKVNANLVTIYRSNEVDPTTYNFFTTPLTAAQKMGNDMDGVLNALKITVDANGASIDQAVSIVANGGTNIIFDPNADISSFFMIDRIPPAVAYAEVTTGGALIVCSFGDDTCKSILIKNSLTKSELAQQAASLSKNQEIIFYCT